MKSEKNRIDLPATRVMMKLIIRINMVTVFTQQLTLTKLSAVGCQLSAVSC